VAAREDLAGDEMIDVDRVEVNAMNPSAASGSSLEAMNDT
jgi:hypothetical protein